MPSLAKKTISPVILQIIDGYPRDREHYKNRIVARKSLEQYLIQQTRLMSFEKLAEFVGYEIKEEKINETNL